MDRIICVENYAGDLALVKFNNRLYIYSLNNIWWQDSHYRGNPAAAIKYYGWVVFESQLLGVLYG